MPDGAQLTAGQEAVLTPDGSDERVRFVIDGVHGDRITLRATDGNVPPLRDGTPARLEYVDRFSVYTADVAVLAHEQSGVVVGITGGDEPVRRRLYVRLHAPLDATCLLLDALHNTFTELDASIVDIGGGGAALAVPAIAPTGATIVCSIALPQSPPVVAITHVLPSDADPRDEPARRHVRVQFSLIAEADRDRLLRFILDVLAHSPRSA